MLTIYKNNFSFTVQAIFFIISVVYEAGFVAVASGVYDPVVIEIEQK